MSIEEGDEAYNAIKRDAEYLHTLFPHLSLRRVNDVDVRLVCSVSLPFDGSYMSVESFLDELHEREGE